MNEQIGYDRYDTADLAISVANPSDVCRMVGEEAYEKLIGVHSLQSFAKNMAPLGEVDLMMLFNLYASGNLSATCSIDLRQSDYCSRKSRTLPADLLKGNGRTYHELLVIELINGLLLCLILKALEVELSEFEYLICLKNPFCLFGILSH